MNKEFHIRLGSRLQKIISFANENPKLWKEVKQERPDLVNKLKKCW